MRKRKNNVYILDLERARKEIADPVVQQNADCLTSLSGAQCQMVLFFYCLIKKRTDQATGPLTLSYLSDSLKINRNTLKNALLRLQKKQVIVREFGKAGRGGWVNFKLADNLYQALSQKESLVGAFKEEDLASSEENKTPIAISLSPLPEPWQAIDYSVLTEIGFNETHLRQLCEMQILDPLVVQDSIYHFAFDLKHNNRKAKIRGECLNYFMGILLKRSYTAPSNYIHPSVEARQHYLDMKRQEQKQREALDAELQTLEFKEWYEHLSDDEIKNLTPEVPEGPSPNIRQMLLMRALKKHFIEEIWPLRCREILRSQPNWTKSDKRLQTMK